MPLGGAVGLTGSTIVKADALVLLLERLNLPAPQCMGETRSHDEEDGISLAFHLVIHVHAINFFHRHASSPFGSHHHVYALLPFPPDFAALVFFIPSRTLSGVTGSSVIRTPVASSTALA